MAIKKGMVSVDEKDGRPIDPDFYKIELPSNLKSIEKRCFKSSVLSSISTTNKPVKMDLIIENEAFGTLYFVIQKDAFSLPNNTYKIYNAFLDSRFESIITFPERTRYIGIIESTDSAILDFYLREKAKESTYAIYQQSVKKTFMLHLINNTLDSLPMILDFSVHLGMEYNQARAYKKGKEYLKKGPTYKKSNVHLFQLPEAVPPPDKAYLLFYKIPTKDGKYAYTLPSENRDTIHGWGYEYWKPLEKIYEFVGVDKYVEKWIWNPDKECYEEIKKEEKKVD